MMEEKKKKEEEEKRRKEKDLVIQGRVRFGPSWIWAELVLGRVDSRACKQATCNEQLTDRNIVFFSTLGQQN